MTVWPVLVDRRPDYMTPDDPACSLLLAPVGTQVLIGLLDERLAALKHHRVIVVPVFDPPPGYDEAVRAACPSVAAVVPRALFGRHACTWEPSDYVLMVDPTYYPSAGLDIQPLLLAAAEVPRRARHVVPLEARPLCPRELVELDDAGLVQTIHRYYGGITSTVASGVFCSLVPICAFLQVRDRPFASLADVRVSLVSAGVPSVDDPLPGGLFDLSSEAALLALNDRHVIDACNGPGAAAAGAGAAGTLGPAVAPSARLLGPVVLQEGASVGAGATIVGPSVIGQRARVGQGALVAQSLLGPGAVVPDGAQVHRRAVWGRLDPARAGDGMDEAAALGLRPGGPLADDELFDDRPTPVLSPRLKVAVDVLASAVALVVLSPLLLIIAVLVRLESLGPALYGDRREGKNGRVFRCYKFRSMCDGADAQQRDLQESSPLDGPQFKLDRDPRVTRLGRFLRATNLDELPQLINVVLGQMSLVGPRPSPFRENQVCVPWREARLSVRPGITGLWQVCRHNRGAGDFHQWIQYDLLYVRYMSLSVDIRLLLATVYSVVTRRHVPVSWIIPAASREAAPSLSIQHLPASKTQADLLGVPLHNRLRMSAAIHRVLALAEGDEPAQVSYVNAHCVNVALERPEYMDALRRSRLVLVDGAGIRLAGRLLGFPVADNVNGTDFFPRLLSALEHRPLPIFLLGGAPGTPDRVARWIAEHYPGVEVAGVRHGYFQRDEQEDIVSAIRDSGAKILLVALGVPMQELWIGPMLGRTGARVALGVGGLFDFYSGRIPRAPAWMRQLGLEWMFRLYQEPGRLWRRYLVGNAVFVARVIGARLKMRRVPGAGSVGSA